MHSSTIKQTPFHQANFALQKDFKNMHDNVVASLNTMVELQQQLPNKEAPSLPTLPPVVYLDTARVDTLTF